MLRGIGVRLVSPKLTSSTEWGFIPVKLGLGFPNKVSIFHGFQVSMISLHRFQVSIPIFRLIISFRGPR